MKTVTSLIMAGGRGERLYPLTRDRAKPAVPFGGIYRIIDFTLSNCINSGMRHIYVLSQYKSLSFEEAQQVIDDYICFYNYERIQLKTRQTPYQLRCLSN